MANGSYRRTDCRLCGGSNLELALPIAATPIGDHYVKASQLDDPQPLHSLDLHLCGDCAHLQLLSVVDPEQLFGEYTFVTASSGGLVEHFRKHAEGVAARVGLGSGGLAVEIGSNDGSLLRFSQPRGLQALGVDPAREIARADTAAGVENLTAFFTHAQDDKIRADVGPGGQAGPNND